jgi:hypothetical protein
MKKLFFTFITTCLLATAALASDFEKAQKIFDQLTDLLEKSSQMVAANNSGDMRTCNRLEKLYAPKIKELLDSTIPLDADYSYTRTAADAMQWCLSCNDTQGNCEYAKGLLQKASDQFIRHEKEGKK